MFDSSPVEVDVDKPEDIALLSHFPIPPSTNHLYKTVRVRGKIRRAPAKEYVAFRNACRIWMMTHQQELMHARRVGTKVAPGKYLHIDITLKFHKSHIIQKNGEPRKLDGSNRIKAIEDAVSEMIGVDDKWIWSGAWDKQIQPDDQPEDVEITLLVSEL